MRLWRLLDEVLPLNRKERYYTGTVLPGIVCADEMRHLHLLAELLGHHDVQVRSDPADTTVLFFTEYGLLESTFGERWEGGLLDGITTKDTPDVVVLLTEPKPVLIALEAKLYDRPSKPELLAQLEIQRGLLEHVLAHLTHKLGVEPAVAHAALLPGRLAEEVGGLGVPVITWEQVHTAFAPVAPRYWLAVLDEALRRYDELVSKWTGYQQGERTGAELVAELEVGRARFRWMGRQGGLHGTLLATDIATGAWEARVYQCRWDPPPASNTNWFSVADFAAAVKRGGQVRNPAVGG